MMKYLPLLKLVWALILRVLQPILLVSAFLVAHKGNYTEATFLMTLCLLLYAQATHSGSD